ncbi:hypothetical protein DEU56DRAFT_840043 [Suillus clintonianus]|uniref:uncharacterized protein n=1 Tax=Suillus clintonianus TaxID=1904413 RepID=UPI001B87395A|nr:uncharacterized protein DEU56DRAFT_840043 [Suillus clintonianus]KAG2116787.1 hypothetical protein DEU56DRAFT_840043 [Suillus clintonianus]
MTLISTMLLRLRPPILIGCLQVIVHASSCRLCVREGFLCTGVLEHQTNYPALAKRMPLHFCGAQAQFVRAFFARSPSLFKYLSNSCCDSAFRC